MAFRDRNYLLHNFIRVERAGMDTEMLNEQRLWMNMSLRISTKGNTGLFAQVSEMMQEITQAEIPEDGNETEILFPSNQEWQTKIYFKLIEKQRKGENLDQTRMDDDDSLNESKPVLHDWNILPSKDKKVPFCAPDAARLAKKEFLQGPGPITWSVSDIAKAGQLLATPPLPTTFSDEQEMRRVYTLIYDVYRYKNILSQALQDSSFFLDHDELKSKASLVWLLLFDLYHRGFKKRSVLNMKASIKLFPEAGLQEVERILWLETTKVAAAIARLRIKNAALRLSQLLPQHLRDERVSSQARGTPVTCWVNIKKVKNIEELSEAISRLLNLELIPGETTLESHTFKWDAHCPHFIIFHPSLRSKLAQSSLVLKHKLIVQDRSFCLGPATFGKLISEMQLRGSVIQSHVNSPRTTAYLASLLSQNENIKKLLAFSAGNRKQEYESYFHDLGLKNILIYSEKLVDFPTDSNSLEEVIAVFATPPNSYSAVVDPIDLVCSRGGDLAMLEVLTETDDTDEGRKRVAAILEEQKKTLKYAMSRPQIQFVLYETHSEIDAENGQMIQKTVSEINKSAMLHHASVQGKLRHTQAIEEIDGKEINNNEVKPVGIDGDENLESQAKIVRRTKFLADVVVPDCDLFDVPNIPDLCPNITSCQTLADEGCFLALLQRKQVTKMDNKYLIQIAESRGLFGNDNAPKKVSKSAKKKVEQTISPTTKTRKRVRDLEIDRIAAPTISSNQHASVPQPGSSAECSKTNQEFEKVSQTRRWWTETARHITNVRSHLSRQKPKSFQNTLNDTKSVTKYKAQNFVTTLVKRGQKVDEIVAKSMEKPWDVPVYPRLRLTRNKSERKQAVPVHVTVLSYPGSEFW